MNEVLVIGHRNPDTDAICSAIGYAEFKRRTGMAGAVAARCGDTNERIDFVLKSFGVPAPRFVSDVSPKVRDVMQTKVISVPPTATVAEALGLMDEKNIRALPVLTEDQICVGLVSLFKTARFFFPAANRDFDSRRVITSIRGLARTLGGKMLFATEPDREEDLVLMVGAMSLESFTQRVAKAPREKLLVVVGDRYEIQLRAIRERVRLLVITGGLDVEHDVVEQAKRNEVALVLSPHDSATTTMLCRASIPVNRMIHEDFLSFREDQPLDAVRHLARETPFHIIPVLDQARRTLGVVTKTDFLRKVERQLILVDHNELSQAVHGADKVEIIEIIDHHRIGALATQQPILFRNEPVGSTSTIVADCFFRQGIEMPKEIAGLLLAGLVSDTLNLTSPTSTDKDAETLKRLESLSEVNATRFTESLFASGSVLTSKPAAQAITADCKEYTEHGRSFSVAQIEELGFDQFLKRKTEVMSALESYRSQKGYYFSALMITDVVLQTSLLLISATDDFLRQIDQPRREPGIFELEGIVSRKKQLLPYLTHCLALGVG